MRSERGQIVPLAAFVCLVLLGLSAFAIDLGHAYLVKRQLQNSVDSAALAGAYVLPDTATATTDATAYAAANAPANVVTTYGYSTSAGVLSVTGAADSPTWFARIFGFNNFHVAAHANAIAIPAGGRLVEDGYVVTQPANTVAPSVTSPHSPPAIGDTLTANRGTWSGDEPSYTYQWQRCGVNIAGATGTTYVVVSADAGCALRVTVTATNTAGSQSVNSPATGVVPPPAPVYTAVFTPLGSSPCPGTTNNFTCYGTVTFTRPAGGPAVFAVWCRTSAACTPNQFTSQMTAGQTSITFVIPKPASGFPCRVYTTTNGTTFVPTTPVATSATC